jgi:putative flippase GtrA
MSASPGPTADPSLFARAHASVDVLYREIVKFGAVGAIAFVVDIGVFNLMRTGIIGGDHGLAEKPLTAKTISVLAATIVAWLGNRYWTFRHRRRASLRREFSLFLLMNVGGLAISLACLGFSHYVLGLTSALSDNIAGNVIGLGLGTLFRFWAYRQLVFTTEGLAEELNTGSIPVQPGPVQPTPDQPPTEPTPSGELSTGSAADQPPVDPATMLDLRDQVWSSQPAPDPVTVASNGSSQRREV